MAFTQSQLDKLEEAIALGALIVHYDDKRVQYRSLSEMRSVREQMRRELGIVQAGSNRIYPTTSKGTC